MPAGFSLRLLPHLWRTEERVLEVLALLKAHPEISQVAFFTSSTHAPLPLGELRERAAHLREVMPRFKAIGVSVGINHLATIGHLDEDVEHTLPAWWQHLIDSKGVVAKGSFCLSDPRVRDYVRDSYRALAQAEPEFVWVDDDVRLEGHAPLGCACFCELCLEAFAKYSGKRWSREELVASFGGARENSLSLRRAWMEHNRRYIADALSLIRAEVDETNPQLSLGFMTTPLIYSGADFSRWAHCLEGDQKAPVKWRPGGGFYEESLPAAFVTKMHFIGAQVAPLPDAIRDIQYEHENFPYQSIRKSRTVFAAEIAAAIGAGCTGAALNVMGLTPDSIAEYSPLFQRLQDCSAFFHRACDAFGRSACEGIGIATSPDALAAWNPDGAWPCDNPWDVLPAANEWSEIGLPFSYGEQGRCIALLLGDGVLEWSRAQLEEILSGAVIMDGRALMHLQEMGLENHAGFKREGARAHDAIEVLGDDEINGEYSGWSRDCRPAFWSQESYLFSALNNKSRELSRLVDFQKRDLGIASGVYENEMGGRVAVLGYSPWKMMHSLSKTNQLKTLCRWLSRETLPAYLESYARALLWCRRDAKNQTALMALNISLDAQDMTIRVRREADAAGQSMVCVRMDGSEISLQPTDYDGRYAAYVVPDLGAWQAALLVQSS